MEEKKKENKKEEKEKEIKKPEEKKEEKKKHKKAFTLIELLAVIIILGILMIIAIPSVTSYISGSRKSAYVDTAKEIVAGTRNVVNEGKLGMYDTNTTYFIPSKYIKTENASKSPYGEFTQAYAVVTYDGKGYDYYWISVDDAGQGVKGIIKIDILEEDHIESDLKDSDIESIVTSTGVGTRTEIKILQDDETWREIHLDNITGNVPEGGGSISGNGSGGTTSGGCTGTCVCRRATTLHQETCDTKYCVVAQGTTTTYGNLGTPGSYHTGDAYDCDVNGDGVFNSENERFYYIKSDGNYSILLYYSNVINNGTPTPYGDFFYSEEKYIDEYYGTLHTRNRIDQGPVIATGHAATTNPDYSTPLPSTSKWSNVSLRSTTRAITGPNGETGDGEVTYPTNFSYNGLAARLLTYQEFSSVCSNKNNCLFALEQTTYGIDIPGYDYPDWLTGQTVGWWMETPYGDESAYVVDASYYIDYVNYSGYGVRPAIEVPSSKVEK